MWINIYASVYTHNMHVHEANNPPNMLWACALDKENAHQANPQIVTRCGAVTRHLYSMSSSHGLKMFEKHWKLMASVLNLLVSISNATLSTAYSLFVLYSWEQLTHLSVEWGEMVYFQLQPYSMCPHTSVHFHLSASLQTGFPTQVYVSEHS